MLPSAAFGPDDPRSLGMSAASLLALALLLPGAGPDPADEALLKGAGLGADGPALLAFFRQRTVRPEDEKRAAELVAELGNTDYAVREKASRQLKALGPAALPALRRAAQSADAEVKRRARDCLGSVEAGLRPEVAGAAARLLAARTPEGAVEALLAYLPSAPDADAEEEAQLALLALTAKAGQPGPDLVAALEDKAPCRRAAAALAVGHSGSIEQRRAVRRLLADADPNVRLLAARGLLAARDREAVPAVIDLLTVAPVAARAEDVLLALAGEAAPKAALGEDVAARRRCRDAWQAWWSAQGDKLDLARADLDPLHSDPTRRAAELGRRFMEALFKGDAAAARRVAALPFVVGSQERFTTPEQLDKFVGEVKGRINGKKYAWKADRTVRGDEFFRENGGRASKPPEGVPPRELRVFHARVTEAGDKNTEWVVVFVRTGGGRARVVGVDSLRTPPKPR
jgi:HEAT repeat protein